MCVECRRDDVVAVRNRDVIARVPEPGLFLRIISAGPERRAQESITNYSSGINTHAFTGGEKAR